MLSACPDLDCNDSEVDPTDMEAPQTVGRLRVVAEPIRWVGIPIGGGAIFQPNNWESTPEGGDVSVIAPGVCLFFRNGAD